MERIDAFDYLHRMVGRSITTVSGRTNRILEVGRVDVLVGTDKSPLGKPVPLEWVQVALDRLVAGEEVEISVDSLGFRSAFVGAVLLTVPGSTKLPTSPPRVRIGSLFS